MFDVCVDQTRDIKLLPMTLRGIINIRRMARKKIHERISALSGENICFELITIHRFVCLYS